MQSPQPNRRVESYAEAAPALGGGAAGPERPARGGEHEKLLLDVIEATLRGEGDELGEAEWQAVNSVARANAGRELGLGVLAELTAALIAGRFASLAGDPQLVQRMSLRISGSLWSHAASRERLHRFWRQISEGVS